VATNSTVVNGSDRSGADDWSELERGFFESAPPDVAVPPPAPPRFDDLEPVARVERRSRRRSASRIRSGAGPAPSRERWRALATLAQDLFHRIGRGLAARAAAARPAARATWAWALERTATGRRRLGPALRAMRVAGARRARTFAERIFVQIFVDLPAERPDGKTTLAAAVALIVVCGLSASVLGHIRLTPPPAPDAVVQPSAPR
jgi:hypothetical protein